MVASMLSPGTFHELAEVVNSLFGETWRIAEFGLTNCQLEFERCLIVYEVKILIIPYGVFQEISPTVSLPALVIGAPFETLAEEELFMPSITLLGLEQQR